MWKVEGKKLNNLNNLNALILSEIVKMEIELDHAWQQATRKVS